MRSAQRMCCGWATPHCWHVQVVASAASDSASRMAIFATINSVSAIVIAGLQLFATGFLLTRLKLPTALAASAIFAAGLMAVIAIHPSPVVVGGGEVIRKVGRSDSLLLLVSHVSGMELSHITEAHGLRMPYEAELSQDQTMPAFCPCCTPCSCVCRS